MDRLRSEEKCKVGYLIVFGCLACQKQTKRKCQHIVRPLESTIKDSNSSLIVCQCKWYFYYFLYTKLWSKSFKNSCQCSNSGEEPLETLRDAGRDTWEINGKDAWPKWNLVSELPGEKEDGAKKLGWFSIKYTCFPKSSVIFQWFPCIGSYSPVSFLYSPLNNLLATTDLPLYPRKPGN